METTTPGSVMHATFVELKASHFAQMEHPGVVHRLLVEFLGRVG